MLNVLSLNDSCFNLNSNVQLNLLNQYGPNDRKNLTWRIKAKRYITIVSCINQKNQKTVTHLNKKTKKKGKIICQI